ncbi:MAG: hypothetical protein V9E87_16290 [Gemmatimonadales bacterium]
MIPDGELAATSAPDVMFRPYNINLPSVAPIRTLPPSAIAFASGYSAPKPLTGSTTVSRALA